VSSYKSEQRRLTHRGREFHFVSYEGRPANERKGETALPAMWFLMSEGKRTAVMPQVLGQEITALDLHLLGWLDEHVFGGPAVARRVESRRR
jgi:hypothetical protein